MKIDIEAAIRFDRGTPAVRRFRKLALVGLIGTVAGLVLSTKAILFSYLVAFAAVLVLVLGMLFFVLLHHAVDAGWSTVVRRWAEHFLTALPVLVLLFLPIFVFKSTIYEWVTADDPMQHHKEPFLNANSFGTRAFVYFAVWLILVRILRGRSLAQDETGEPRLSFSMRRWSAPGLILFAFTLSFAAIDWFMSVDYHWFSTMFGTYVFAHGAVACFAMLAMLAAFLRAGPLHDKLTDGTQHDLGKLTFAFAVFWGYIAFSQWFLIWYGNIPEETYWMMARWEGMWSCVAVTTVVLLFVLPFVFLMSAAAKSNSRVIYAIGALILIGHYTGLYWLIMPKLHPDGIGPMQVLWDLAALALVVGLCGTVVAGAFARGPLVPLHDPRLKEAVA